MSRRRLIRDGFSCRPAWCEEHSDFAWLFDDKSGDCFYACRVEMGTSQCRFVPLRALQKAKR
jgi:hypothetical protein